MTEAAAQTCSQCGWTFDVEALQKNTCKKCKSAILVVSVAYLEKFQKPAIQKYIAQYSRTLKTDPQDRDALLAIGICYLKLGLFDLCDRFLRTFIDSHPDDPAGYFYRAICHFKGKRPRTASLPVVREAEQLLCTAMELDPTNGRYDVTLAAIRHDYYLLNGMRAPTPDPDTLVCATSEKYIDWLEIDQVLGLLNIPDSLVRKKLVTLCDP